MTLGLLVKRKTCPLRFFAEAAKTSVHLYPRYAPSSVPFASPSARLGEESGISRNHLEFQKCSCPIIAIELPFLSTALSSASLLLDFLEGTQTCYSEAVSSRTFPMQFGHSESIPNMSLSLSSGGSFSLLGGVSRTRDIFAHEQDSTPL